MEHATATLEVHHRRVGSADETHFVEPILADEMQRSHCIAVPWTKVEQPVCPFCDFPAPAYFDHGKLIGVKREAILAGQIAARCNAGGGEPVHHRPHIPAGWSTYETHRGQLVMLDDSEDAIGFGFAGAGVDHPMITFHHLPAPAELGDR